MNQPSPPAHSALELLRARARTLCDALLDRLPAGAVRAVFVGGSVGRGDVWAARVDGGWEIYSDIDLYVVAGAPRVLEMIRHHARDLAETMPETAWDARFLRGVEVGVYTREDLLAQPLRPGTVRLADESFWLFGDPASLTHPAREGAAGMPRDEALYLLENRIAELAGFDPGVAGPRRRLAHVCALKTRLDVGAAHLIAHGAYTSSVAARMDAIRAGAARTVSPEVLADLEEAYAGYRDLDAHLASAAGPAPFDRVRESAATAWRTLAERILGAGDAAAQLRRRCAHGHRRANYREFLRVGRTAGISRLRAMVRGVAAASFSARAALRTYALAGALRAREPEAAPEWRAFDRYLDRLTRSLGFEGGPLAQRVASARRAVS